MNTSLESFTRDFQGKRVLIMGLGLMGGGMKLVKFLHNVGCQITISDQKTKEELSQSLSELADLDITYSLGGHDLGVLNKVDFIIRNPGVPKAHPMLMLAKKKNIPIYMEAALFAQYTQKPIIGITGTRGKTTTSLLISHILNSTKDLKVRLAGNIPGTCALSLIETESESGNWGTVLELSSWQLQGFEDLRISPQVAVLTNIYPDHLNRYSSMEEYGQDKQVITKYQSKEDQLIFNGKNLLVGQIADQSEAHAMDYSTLSLPEGLSSNLLGPHNLENIRAAFLVAQTVGLSEEKILDSIKSFQPVPFRLEHIKTINQVKYINDTTSTTPVALQAALNSFDDPILLIVGGNSKGLPLDDLIATINNKENISQIILIPGSGTDEIRPRVKAYVEKTTLKEAVEYAHQTAKPESIILFSPGFTSFSQYKNEFDRGEHFNQIVSQL